MSSNVRGSMKIAINDHVTKLAQEALESGVESFPFPLPLTERLSAILSDDSGDVASFKTITFGGTTYYVGLPKGEAGA